MADALMTDRLFELPGEEDARDVFPYDMITPEH